MNVKSTSHTKQADHHEAPRITSDWAAKAEIRKGDFIEREASPPVRVGRPPKPEAERKRQVTLRIEPVLLERMRASGKGWQSRVEEVLRHEYLGKQSAAMSIAALGKSVAAAMTHAVSKAPGKQGVPRVNLRRSGRGDAARKKSA